MPARLTFQKALHKLDRGRLQEGLLNLEAALAEAKSENDDMTVARALCCLGEAFLQAGDALRARAALGELVARKFDNEVADVVAWELCRARQLLDESR